MNLETSDAVPVLPAGGTATPGAPASEDIAAFRNAVLDKLTYMVGKDPGHAQEHDWLVATALAVRDRIVDRWMDATRRTYRDGRKRVYYFSLEFLIGRLLFDALGNLGVTDTAREALRDLGVDLDRLRKLEPDAALGNGGLGRLAACFMESMATLGIPAHGYGIRYDHGIFRQVAEGRLAARAARRLAVRRQPVGVRASGGHLHDRLRRHGRQPSRTTTARRARSGTPPKASTPSPTTRRSSAGAAGTSTRCGCGPRGRATRCGSRTSTAATTSARWPTACASRRSRACSTRATRRRPDTSCGCGRSSSSPPRRCRTCCAGTRRSTASSRRSPITSSIQLNDTHPAIAVPELMRLLIDVHGMPWELAWDITTSVFNYTNHTLLPEALETWPVSLMENLLPRHMQIIYLINALHLDRAARRRARRRRLPVVDLADRGGPQPRRADGPPRFPRLAPRQRRFGAAHATHAADGVPRPALDLSGPHRQQDQRHHVPPLAATRRTRG